jgi:branched-chain amino acid transport system permease protein
VIFCTNLGLPIPVGLILSMFGVLIMGVVIEKLAIYPLSIRRADIVTLLIVTMALSMSLQGSAFLIFGKDTKAFPGFSGEALKLLGASISRQVLWILAVLGITSFILWYFFNRTIYGTAMKACSEDRIAARAMGINPDRMSSLSWGMSGGLGAVAGALIIPITLMSFNAGVNFIIKGLAAVVVGGIGSYRGAVIGGFLIGLLESMGAGFISPLHKDIFSMATLIAVLLIRPSGMFGKKEE